MHNEYMSLLKGVELFLIEGRLNEVHRLGEHLRHLIQSLAEPLRKPQIDDTPVEQCERGWGISIGEIWIGEVDCEHDM
jgi:hypothetical protein